MICPLELEELVTLESKRDSKLKRHVVGQLGIRLRGERRWPEIPPRPGHEISRDQAHAKVVAKLQVVAQRQDHGRRARRFFRSADCIAPHGRLTKADLQQRTEKRAVSEGPSKLKPDVEEGQEHFTIHDLP